MKNLFTIALLAATLGSFGQAPLPTSWNFDDPTPEGWEESLNQNPGNTRYPNGFIGAACKLDGDDEFVVVNFSDVCGGVTYNIKGEGSQQTDDVFTIQESADGSAWTTMRELIGSDLDGASYTPYTDFPMSASRYVRWYFTEKQSGRNVGLDEISLSTQVPTNAQEIRVYSGVDDIVNNATFVVGNNATTILNIENVNLFGGNDLNISSMTISGSNAADFAISGVTTPFAVGPVGVQGFNIDFTPGANGSHFATLTIANDDANGDESPFVIDLYGIGGDFATEPPSSPTNLSFSNVTSYGYDVSFDDAAVVPENYIVLRGIENQFTGLPSDGATYSKGDWIDAGTQVVHIGPADSFKPTYNVANTSYFFSVYAFNGPAGYQNYFTSSPLEGSVTTPVNMMGNYYGALAPSSSTFLTDLQTTISNPYSQIFYSNYTSIMINKFGSRDTTDGDKVVTCVYTGHQYVYSGAFFYNPIGVLSREHSWPHSWMPTFPDQDGDEYSDMHNLFPAHQNEANVIRSNLPLGEVVSVLSTYLDGTVGDDANGNKVYEPRDQHKGDAARAIFYMAAKWNGLNGVWDFPNPISSSLVPYTQNQDVLKAWHWQDPPDNWEIARNDFIQSEQDNRNPFVDSVNWACYIDFSDFSHISDPQEFPCLTTPNSIQEEEIGDLKISPNPAVDFLTIDINVSEKQNLTAVVYDLSGKNLLNEALGSANGHNRFTLNVSELSSGMYTLSLRSAEGQTNRTFIVK
jgi:endonuclease I